jgi:hypothetical protein
MPRLKINFQNTIIYKLVCNNLNITEIYIGSTTNFTGRKRQHKDATTNLNCKEYNQTKYKFVRDNGGWENWSMIEIEKYPCNDSNESKSRERYWIETLKPLMNTQTPNMTKQEYKNINKEHIKEYQKQYKIIHRGKNIMFTCACGSICRNEAKAKHFKTNKHINFLNL